MLKTVVSVDVETDGHVPGLNSLLQIGAVAFNLKGKKLARFSINLKPLPEAKPGRSTMVWWKTQPEEIWKKVMSNQQDPKVAMLRYANWLAQFPSPRMLMAPVLFDGCWLRYYLQRFVGRSDLWHNAIDLRSVLFAFTGMYQGDYQMAVEFLTGNKYQNESPHLAVEDAEMQGQYLFWILEWATKNKLRRILDE